MLTGMSNVNKLSEERTVGWLVMAAQQWCNDCAFVIPPSVALDLVTRGWMKQQMKTADMPGSDEYVAASFTPEGMRIVAANAESWGVDMTPDESDEG
jgi:hypothetical protein